MKAIAMLFYYFLENQIRIEIEPFNKSHHYPQVCCTLVWGQKPAREHALILAVQLMEGNLAKCHLAGGIYSLGHVQGPESPCGEMPLPFC
jgi:hypothetical protein